MMQILSGEEKKFEWWESEVVSAEHLRVVVIRVDVRTITVMNVHHVPKLRVNSHSCSFIDSKKVQTIVGRRHCKLFDLDDSNG